MEQYHSEHFANLHLDALGRAVGLPALDWTFGPVAFRASMARHWLQCRQHGRTRRPGRGRADHLRLEAPSRLRAAARWASEQSHRRLGPAVPPWNPSEAPPKVPDVAAFGHPGTTASCYPYPYPYP